jgi:hypothetical protein
MRENVMARSGTSEGRRGRHVVAWSIVVLALLLAWPAMRGSRNFAGECPNEGRRLTEAEFFERAVRRNASQIGIATDAASAQAFLDRHPDCCKLMRASDDPTAHWLDRVWGSYGAEVELTYALPESLRKSYGGSAYHQFVRMGTCGEPGDMYGESIHPDR